ncbi:methylated-DNA--[protein]-cysteine S-methyltransferase [Aerococcus urinaeequi]
MLYKYPYSSELGTITLLANDHGLLGAWFEDQANFGSLFDLEKANNQQSRIIDKAVKWLDAYFAKQPLETIDFQLMPQGTAFQQDVWTELQKIPYGQVMTLDQLVGSIAARQTKGRGSKKAVIGAIESNPIALMIPSHRILLSLEETKNRDKDTNLFQPLKDFEIK